MDKIEHSFGNNLRREIKRKGLTFGAAAEAFDISLSYLNKLMNGENGPSLDLLVKITEKLGVDPNALLLNTDQERPLNRGELIEKLFSRLASLDEEQLADTLDWVSHFALERASDKGTAV